MGSLSVPQIMNLFQILGDSVHVLAIFILLFQIVKYKTCEGISRKSQVLLALVFATRCTHLFVEHMSVYDGSMKIFFLCSSFTILCFIYCTEGYQGNLDSFRLEFLVPVPILLARLVRYENSWFGFFWAFSIYLEAVAMWPQFYLISNTKKVNRLLFCYLTCSGLYSNLYFANWIYRYCTEDYFDPISSVSGSVQTVPYFIFWFCCLFKGVLIISDKYSRFDENLTQVNRQEEIFVIRVEEKK